MAKVDADEEQRFLASQGGEALVRRAFRLQATPGMEFTVVADGDRIFVYPPRGGEIDLALRKLIKLPESDPRAKQHLQATGGDGTPGMNFQLGRDGSAYWELSAKEVEKFPALALHDEVSGSLRDLLIYPIPDAPAVATAQAAPAPKPASPASPPAAAARPQPTIPSPSRSSSEIMQAAFKPYLAPNAAIDVDVMFDKIAVYLPPNSPLAKRLEGMLALEAQAKGQNRTAAAGAQQQLDRYFQATGGDSTPQMNIKVSGKRIYYELSREDLDKYPDPVAAVQQEIKMTLGYFGLARIDNGPTTGRATATNGPEGQATNPQRRQGGPTRGGHGQPEEGTGTGGPHRRPTTVAER